MSEKEKSRDYRRAFDGRPGSGNPSVPSGVERSLTASIMDERYLVHCRTEPSRHTDF